MKRLPPTCLLLPLLAVACASSLQHQQWKAADQANTIQAYEVFLGQFPEGELATEARLRLGASYDLLRGFTALHLVVEESYSSVPASRSMDGYSLPFGDSVRELLQLVDVSVVDGSDDGADGALRIQVEGRALGNAYAAPNRRGYVSSSMAKTMQFAGATLSGSISLQAATGAAYRLHFSGIQAPPDRITSSDFPSPHDAPFPEVFAASFAPAMAQVIGDLHGIDPLLPALSQHRQGLRHAAVAALAQIGDPRATPHLIEALEGTASPSFQESVIQALATLGDPRATAPILRLLTRSFDRKVRECAAEALGKLGDTAATAPLIEAVRSDAKPVRQKAADALRRITGQDYGTNGDRWLEWWQTSHQDTPPSPSAP